jgi:diacylglycerol kinase
MKQTSKDKTKEITKANGEFDRDAIKKHGFARFLRSWSYSFDGLKYAYKYEQSMLIHVVVTIAVVAANIILKVSGMHWLITIMAIGMVLAAELINTAIEAVVDMVTLDIHPLAKIAKDCGSAATFVLAMMAAAIGFVIYVPYIVDLVGNL